MQGFGGGEKKFRFHPTHSTHPTPCLLGMGCGVSSVRQVVVGLATDWLLVILRGAQSQNWPRVCRQTTPASRFWSADTLAMAPGGGSQRGAGNSVGVSREIGLG